MKFGMNLLLWSGDLNDDMMPVLESLKKMGYDGVEVPIFDRDPKKFGQLGKRLDEIGPGADGRHHSHGGRQPDQPRCQGARSRRGRQEAGARLLPGRWAPTRCAARITRPSASSAARARRPTNGSGASTACGKRPSTPAKAGVMLGVEYLNRFECYFLNSAADTVRFVREVDHPNCRMMYDTFHANIEEKNIAEAIRTCADVHGPRPHLGERPQHAGRGARPLGRRRSRRSRKSSYDGWMVIEAFGLALPEIAAATKIWRRMYQSEEQLARDGLAFMKARAGK